MGRALVASHDPRGSTPGPGCAASSRSLGVTRPHRPASEPGWRRPSAAAPCRAPEVPLVPIDTILWIVLGVTIAVVLTLDLLVFNREAHAPSFKEAAAFSAFYVGLGLTFGALVFLGKGV